MSDAPVDAPVDDPADALLKDEPEAKRLKLDDDIPGNEQTNTAPKCTDEDEAKNDIAEKGSPLEAQNVDKTNNGGAQRHVEDKADNSNKDTAVKESSPLEAKDEDPKEPSDVVAMDQEEPEKAAVSREIDVGITEYISKHEGFTAIIKQRYSDFLVNEISTAGDRVQLTDKDVPACDNKEPVGECTLKEEWKTQLDTLQAEEQPKHVDFNVDNEDKECRSEIHRAIRENYTGLDSKTIDKDGSKFISVVKSSRQNRGSGRGDRQSWHRKQDYCRFVLYKENKDTNDALFVIAKFLKTKNNAFTFSGTKDKRAKTSQYITIYRYDASRLQAINTRLINMVMGNFSYVDKPLKLGDLTGNHFTIVLRNVTGSKAQIKAAMTSLTDHGFINYFGMQRFGTTSVATHEVGRAMLQARFAKAIELILKPRDGDSSDVGAARTYWWKTRDAKGALEKLGRRTCLERHLLFGLSKHDKKDNIGALSKLPRNTRLMYIHAYQSYVWNVLVSSRIRKHGMKPIIGDLVLINEDTDSSKQKVEALTEDTVSKYSIQDVVMPLPGYDVVYPSNDMAEEYKAMLKADGLEGGLKSPVKDYSLPGNYRKVLAKPWDVEWKTCTYDDHTVPLVQSDWERLEKKELTETQDGRFVALIVEFSLSSSTYATMALREFLKCDTSAASMTQLNVT